MMFDKLFNRRRWSALTLILVLSCALAACSDDDDDNNGVSNGTITDAGTDVSDDSGRTVETLEVLGTYDTQFDTTETITEEQWGSAAIIEWDNEENWAVLQAPSDDEFNPDAFSKNVWTEPNDEGVFHYCTVAFGLETAEEARQAENTADESDLESGCAGFEWTEMTPQ